MKFRMLCLLAAALPCTLQAQEQILIPKTVPYLDASAVNDGIRQSCDWNTQLSEFIVKDAKGLAVISDQPLPQAGQRSLSMVVTHVHAIAGGGFTGPKWAVVRGELHDGDKLVGSFSMQRTGHGKLTICSTLNSLAKELGEDIADWLHHPSLEKSGDQDAAHDQGATQDQAAAQDQSAAQDQDAKHEQ